jgi:Fe2+ or Zn2+ uptake regulation protein
MGELELILHDSNPLPEEQLPQARDTATKQRGMVLDFFRRRFSMSFTPVNVHEALESDGSLILLTSVRRSITDLTKEGRLIKCQWSESKPGAYGKLNRCWTYNQNFLNRLNPQK